MSEQQVTSESGPISPGELADAGGEHKPDENHDGDAHDHHWIKIFINARPKEIDDRELTYNDVLILRYDGSPPTGPNWAISISYTRGPKQNPHGTLTPGHSVHVQEGMLFRVRATDRS